MLLDTAGDADLEHPVHPHDSFTSLKLVFICSWEKIKILMFVIFNFIPTFCIFMVLAWKQYGLVDLICAATNSNRFFVLLLVGKFVFNQIMSYLLGRDNILFNFGKIGRLLCKMMGVLSLSVLLQISFPV